MSEGVTVPLEAAAWRDAGRKPKDASQWWEKESGLPPPAVARRISALLAAVSDP
jgi:hypothetical protein